MSIWILHPRDRSVLAGELKRQDVLPLPVEDGTPDYTSCASQGELRKRLKATFPDVPPESLKMKTERLWTLLRGIGKEDIIAVALPDGEGVLFAQCMGPACFDPASARYLLPIRWFEARAEVKSFRRKSDALCFSGVYLSEVHQPELKTQIRDRLPLPGNRFRKIKWILVIVIAIKFCYIALHMWQRETAGF